MYPLSPGSSEKWIVIPPDAKVKGKKMRGRGEIERNDEKRHSLRIEKNKKTQNEIKREEV